MARTMTRQRRQDYVRRKRVWAREQFAVAASADGAAVDLLTDFRAELGVTSNPPGLTIGGVLLDFTVTNASGRAAAGDYLSFGLLVTSEEVPADVQGPITEPHVDWMWVQSIGAPGAAAGDSVSTFDAMGGPVRVRSKRRMDEIGMRFYLVAQLSGLTTFDFRGTISTLLLLP
jgi:hypothetical protein